MTVFSGGSNSIVQPWLSVCLCDLSFVKVIKIILTVHNLRSLLVFGCNLGIRGVGIKQLQAQVTRCHVVKGKFQPYPYFPGCICLNKNTKVSISTSVVCNIQEANVPRTFFPFIPLLDHLREKRLAFDLHRISFTNFF